MALTRASLLQTLLIAATAAPLAAGCGGKTSDTTDSTTGPGGGGGTSGSSGQGGSGGANGGTSSTGGTTSTTGGKGGSSSGAGGVGPAGSGGGASKIACDNPVPVLVGGQETGFVRCANEALLRVEAKVCPNQVGTKQGCSYPDNPSNACTTNTDCKGSPSAYCGYGPDSPFCQCQTGCLQDSDCASDELCQCGDPVGHCVKATCHSGADCAEGGCALVKVGDPGCSSLAFTCQTKADQCQGDQACQAGGGFKQCHVNALDGSRQCDETSCAVGRPLLVEQRMRLAALTAAPAWG